MKRAFSFMLIFPLLTALAVAQKRQPKSAAPGTPAAIQDLYQKASVAEESKNYAEAAAYYEHLLKLDPALHPLRANLGLMRYLNGEYDRAVKEFRQAFAGDESLQTAQLFLGLTLMELNQPAEAIAHLETAVRHKPQDLNARFQSRRVTPQPQ